MMKKIIILFSLTFFLNGCVESIAVLGSGAANGRVVQSSINSAISLGIKQQTGKSPAQHVLAYAKENNPDKKKETCVSFLESTSSEACYIAKKNLMEIKAKIKEKSKIKNLN
jgi:hypothetical protein